MARTGSHVLYGLDAVVRPPARPVATVGVFDGVHIAHQRLVRTTIRLARRLRGTSVVITFDPDPQTVLDPAHPHPTLMPLAVRLAHLRGLGVDRVWVIPFTRRFARMTAQQFIDGVLCRRLRAAALVVGEGFVFGRNRRGNMDVLRAAGSRHGMRVIAVPKVRRHRAPVSSSRVRSLIAAGRLSAARDLLGRPPELYGVVVRGAGRGRQLGFPTANVDVRSHALPPRGVYAVCLRRLDRPSSTRRGVMNLGVRPTFGPGPLVCEVHLPGFSGTLRGHAVAIALMARLRGERRFPSLQALQRQIRHDVKRAARSCR